MNSPLAQKSIRKSRQRVLWLAAAFFVPLAAAFVLYYGDLWRPRGTTNKGELIHPARPLPAVSLTLADGTQSSPELLIGKWSFVFIGDGQCDVRCRTALADMRQARLLLTEKMDRVQRVFFAVGSCCDNDYLKREQQGLIVARFDNTAFGAIFPTYENIPVEKAGRIYLIDPLGNLMMSYAADAPSMGMLEDIKKLLNLSHIG